MTNLGALTSLLDYWNLSILYSKAFRRTNEQPLRPLVVESRGARCFLELSTTFSYHLRQSIITNETSMGLLH